MYTFIYEYDFQIDRIGEHVDKSNAVSYKTFLLSKKHVTILEREKRTHFFFVMSSLVVVIFLFSTIDHHNTAKITTTKARKYFCRALPFTSQSNQMQLMCTYIFQFVAITALSSHCCFFFLLHFFFRVSHENKSILSIRFLIGR